MFDDIKASELENPFEADDSMSDRQVLYVIWGCEETGDLPTDEAWGILSERYPDDGRFLILNLAEELRNVRYFFEYNAETLMGKVSRLMKHKTELAEPIRHVVALIHEVEEDMERNDRAKFGILTARVGKPEATPAEAHAFFTNYSKEVLTDLHDKTKGNKAIGKSK